MSLQPVSSQPFDDLTPLVEDDRGQEAEAKGILVEDYGGQEADPLEGQPLSIYHRVANFFFKSCDIDFEGRKEMGEKIKETEASIRENTLFWRVKGKDLGLTDPAAKDKEFDLIVGVCDGKPHFMISSEDLRRTPAGASKQVATALGLTAASMASYYFTGEGI